MWILLFLASIFAEILISNGELQQTPIPPELELVFVHSVWRHGDRSQDGHLNNDPLDPSEWVKGGGGYGQLTPEGMEQHFILGKKLKKRYVDTGFLHSFYDSKQVFIRSTDVNRTINSAVSNMLGMYSTAGRPGVDYPDIEGWPRGFMPVPIHVAGPASEDCVASAMCACKRRDELMQIAHTGEQYQNYIQSENYLNITALVSEVFNTTFTEQNLWQVHDAVLIQLIHFPDVIRNQSWFSDEFYENLDELARPPRLFVSGLYDPPIVQGINVRRAILKTRGGSMVNEIAARMRTKAKCAKNAAKCDNYHKELKYYAYSTHDHTVFALLAVLGLEAIVAGPEKLGEWPDYAADLLIELFQNSTDGKPYFRLLYQNNVESDFQVVTSNLKGCKGQEFCDLKAFDNCAKEFRPDRPMAELCLMPVLDENNKEGVDDIVFAPFMSSALSGNHLFFITSIFLLISSIN